MSTKALLGIAFWALLKIASTDAVGTHIKWNKRLEEIESISRLRSYEVEKQRRLLQSQQEESYNFNGTPLRITYYEEPGYFEFYDNDTKATGMCGDIWTILSQVLNFTMVLKRVERNSTGALSKNAAFREIIYNLRDNKTDIIPKLMFSTTLLDLVKFTPVLWLNRNRIFAPVQWRADLGWIFYSFTKEVWALVAASVITLSIASYITQRILIYNGVEKLQKRSCFAHLFYTFATLCNQGNGSDNTRSGSNVLNVTISLFSWLILAAYNSCLINDISHESIDSPTKDLTSLFEDTRRQILVSAGSIGHSIFFAKYPSKIKRRIVAAERVAVVPNIDELYERICSHSAKYVLFDEEDAVAMRDITHCKLSAIDEPSRSVPIASGISRTLKNKRSLEIGIMKLHELGVINRIRHRYVYSKIMKTAAKRTTKVVIDVHRVSITFIILGIGILASVIICVIENIVCAAKKRLSARWIAEPAP